MEVDLLNLDNFNKTEESVFTLLALSTQITQAYDSIFDNEDIVNSDFSLSKNYSYHRLINDTIYDALASQIILKSVSFLEEWNNYFGVKTESKEKEKIIQAKKVAKSTYDCIVDWKGLYDYRNQAIAHNHRDKHKRNIYLINKSFNNAPQTEDEILLLAFCIYKMAHIVSVLFQEETVKVVLLTEQIILKNSQRFEKHHNFSKDCRKKIRFVEEQIRDAIKST